MLFVLFIIHSLQQISIGIFPKTYAHKMELLVLVQESQGCMSRNEFKNLTSFNDIILFLLEIFQMVKLKEHFRLKLEN